LGAEEGIMTNIESFDGGSELLEKLRRDMAAYPERFQDKKTYVYIYDQFVRGVLTTGEAPPSSLPFADCGILGLLDVQTGTIENFWFEPGFDSNLITFIRANPLPDFGFSLSCFEMSFRYAERFLGARLPVILCEGVYLGDIWRGDYWSTIESLRHLDDRLFPEHYWLAVNGYIFDPTAAQWKSVPRKEWFEVTRRWSKSRVLKWLPYVERPENHGQGGSVEDWARRLREHLAATAAQQSFIFEGHSA
jgi:hypothetical protein